MALIEHPNRKQRIGGCIILIAIPTPVIARMIGLAWVANASRDDIVPQGAMLGAYLLLVGTTVLAVLALIFSICMIFGEEKRKRGKRR